MTTTMAFEQAGIKVEKEAEFQELKGAIERVFGAKKLEKFLRQVQSKGLRVRDLEGILAKGIFEALDDSLGRSGKSGAQLYQSLPVSDQAQMREFYLFKLEEVSQDLRTRFHRIYQYY